MLCTERVFCCVGCVCDRRVLSLAGLPCFSRCAQGRGRCGSARPLLLDLNTGACFSPRLCLALSHSLCDSVSCIYVDDCSVFLLNGSFRCHKLSPFSLGAVSVLQVTLSAISAPAVVSHFVSSPFAFHLLVSSSVKCVPHSQHTVRSRGFSPACPPPPLVELFRPFPLNLTVAGAGHAPAVLPASPRTTGDYLVLRFLSPSFCPEWECPRVRLAFPNRCLF